MKRPILTTILSLACFAAYAEWVQIAGTANLKIYVDSATLTHTGNLVRMWELHDFVKPRVAGGKPYYSARFYYEHDCIEKASRVLQISGFAGQMASGELVISDNKPGNMSFVEPRTTGATVLNFACK